MTTDTNPLLQIMTANDIATEFGITKDAIRQYIKTNKEDMSEREVIRKSGGTWLVLRTEAERIWNQ